MIDLKSVRGANYVPSYACTDVMLWEQFDPETIDRELGYAEKLNLNSVRVFLQYIVWEDGPQTFLERFDKLLQLCEKHGITLMPVLFDSCGGEPHLGHDERYDRAATEYTPCWMASPGVSRLGKDNWPKLDAYIGDLVSAYRNDSRIILWDCWNEPAHWSSITHACVHHTIEQVRSHKPSQPVAAGWGIGDVFGDVMLVHTYHQDMKMFAEQIRQARMNCPDVLVTEMAGRPGCGAFEDIIPTCAELEVGWYFWELMAGKTQFRWQWASKPGEGFPSPVFQGVLFPDGTPYDPEEIPYIDGSWRADAS